MRSLSEAIPLKTVSYGPLVTSWCCWEYPRHPNGCGNYADKEDCPPYALLFPSMFDVSNYEIIEGHGGEMFLLKLKRGREPTLWLAYELFDMRAWIEKLQKDNDKISEAQCRIPYLWQPKAEKRLETKIQSFRWGKPFPTDYLLRPEANGVNLFGTWNANAKPYGHPPMDKNPEDEIRLLGMLGKIHAPKPGFGMNLLNGRYVE